MQFLCSDEASLTSLVLCYLLMEDSVHKFLSFVPDEEHFDFLI